MGLVRLFVPLGLDPSLAIAGMTLIGIVLNRVMRPIVMWYRINRMRLSRGSGGSHLEESRAKGENDEENQSARARGCTRVRIGGWRVRAGASGGCGQGGGCDQGGGCGQGDGCGQGSEASGG